MIDLAVGDTDHLKGLKDQKQPISDNHSVKISCQLQKKPAWLFSKFKIETKPSRLLFLLNI